MENPENRLVQRYFRKTAAHPEGAVCHHGDCDFFSLSVCTCGLLHDLAPMNADQLERHYPRFYEEQGQYEQARINIMFRPDRKPLKKH